MKQQLSTWVKLGILVFSLGAAMLGLAMILQLTEVRYEYQYFGGFSTQEKYIPPIYRHYYKTPDEVWWLLWSLISADFACIALLAANRWIEWDNFGVKRFIHSRAFKRCIRWFCWLGIAIIAILAAAAFIDANYLEPKRQAKRAAQQAANQATCRALLHSHYTAKHAKAKSGTPFDDLLETADELNWLININPQAVELWWYSIMRDHASDQWKLKQAKKNGYSPTEILAAFYETDTMTFTLDEMTAKPKIEFVPDEGQK